MDLLANSTKGLGLVNVSGRSRVPYPPTNIIAFMLVKVTSEKFNERIFWAISWSLIEALGFRRVEFFVRSLGYFGQILELCLEINNFLSNSMKMEQKQQEAALSLPRNGRFVNNKMALKSVTPKKNSIFCNIS